MKNLLKRGPMIRFVDLRASDTGERFTFWNTVTDVFVSYDGEQAWSSWDEFESSWLAAQAHNAPCLYTLERFKGLCPDWVLERVCRECNGAGHF